MGTTPFSPDSSFSAALRAERDAYQAFCQLLREEAQALQRGDADALLALAQRKSAQIRHLAQLGEARNQYLRAATGMSDQLGLDAWCDRQDPAGAQGARVLWQELIEAARAARALNEENGATIHLQLAHHQQALAVLLGAAQQTAELYGPEGQPCGGPTGRSLGKA